MNERIMRDSYEVVGSPVEPFEVALDYTTAVNLHAFVEQEFIPDMLHAYGKRKAVWDLTDTSDSVTVGSSFGRQHYSAPDLNVGFATVLKLAHNTDDSWKLRIRDTNYRHDGTENKIARWYKIDVVGDQLVQALREVRIIRTPSDEAFRQLLDDDVVSPARRLFEAPLVTEDCDRLKERLRHVANRAIALAS